MRWRWGILVSRDFSQCHQPFRQELLFQTFVSGFDKLVDMGFFIRDLARAISSLVLTDQEGTLAVLDFLVVRREEGKLWGRIHFLLRTNFHYMIDVPAEGINRLRQDRWDFLKFCHPVHFGLDLG